MNIEMRVVYGRPPRSKTLHYKTLQGAQRGAVRWIGMNPRLDPDGYAISKNGDVLFFVKDCSYEDIFPVSAVMNS